MRKILIGVFLVALSILGQAQVLTQEKNSSMWNLNGPVHTMRQSSYRSDRFDIDGNRLNRFEKSFLLYYEDFVFDSLHSLTYYYSYHKNGNKEDFEQYTFDSLHRIVSITYGEGKKEQAKIVYHYNRLGQLYLADNYNDSGQLEMQTTYRYKENRISEIKIYNMQKIVCSHSKYSYDEAGNLLEMRNMKVPLLQNPPYAFKYSYNTEHLKNVEKYLDDKDQVVWETFFAYDRRHRLVVEETYDGAKQLQKRIEYQYGRKGLLKYETRKDAIRTQNITYYYDRQNRLSYSVNLFGDVNYRTFFLEYDAYGNWTEKVEFDGLQVRITSRELTYF